MKGKKCAKWGMVVVGGEGHGRHSHVHRWGNVMSATPAWGRHGMSLGIQAINREEGELGGKGTHGRLKGRELS